jgi:pimeloyl-ACP methyl ester carboxylesterase
MPLNIVFSHGKESGPMGSKITAMRAHVSAARDCNVYAMDYQSIPCPDDRVVKLVEHLKTLPGEILLVGSSMGGYVSAVAAMQVPTAALLLLAPAFYLQGYKVTQPTIPCKAVTIVHGWLDDVVPYQNSVKFAQAHHAKLILVNDDHRLANSAAVLNSELDHLLSGIPR